jgi:hypothetical protein
MGLRDQIQHNTRVEYDVTLRLRRFHDQQYVSGILVHWLKHLCN